MNLIAELQSTAVQVEDKGDHVVADLLARAGLALVAALNSADNFRTSFDIASQVAKDAVAQTPPTITDHQGRPMTYWGGK
jgi:hypothetical protein